MRRWLRALTCIRTGTVFGWCMKVNWSQGWLTLGCKLPWFWCGFTGSWVISTVGLEISKHGPGRGGQGPKCRCTAWEGCFLLRRRWAIPKQSTGTRARKPPSRLISRSFASSGYWWLQGWTPKGCYRALNCWQGPGATSETLLSPHVTAASPQGLCSGWEAQGCSGKIQVSCKWLTETWEEWSHPLMELQAVSNRDVDPAQTLRSRYVTKPKRSLPL